MKILLLYFLLVNTMLWAQPVVSDTFPVESEACYDHLKELILVEKQSESIPLKHFRRYQKQGQIHPEYYKGLAKIGTVLLNNNLKRRVWWEAVVTVVNTFVEDSTLSNRHFEQWVVVSERWIKGQPAHSSLSAYLDWSKTFWQNQFWHQVPKSHSWKANNFDFSIELKENQPCLNYTQTAIYCYRKLDTLCIKKASGYYYPMTTTWKGKEGTVQWSEQKSEVILKNYTINTKLYSYENEDAALKALDAPSIPKIGIFKDNAALDGYPKFFLKENHMVINEVTLSGNVSCLGETVQCAAPTAKSAYWYLKNNKGQVLAKAISAHFEQKKAGVFYATAAAVTLYLYGEALDSIEHPSVQLMYNASSKVLTLRRNAGLYADYPFYNSLQQVDLDVTSLVWRLKEDRITFKTEQGQLLAYSTRYFDDQLLLRYQSIGSTNPLIQIGRYGKKLAESFGNFEPWNHWIGIDTIAAVLDKRMDKIMLMTASEIEKARRNKSFKIIEQYQDFKIFARGYPTVFKFGVIEVQNLLNLIPKSSLNAKSILPLCLEMVRDGFIDYDKNHKAIRLRKKLLHYLACANSRQLEYDYDKIKLKATADAKTSIAVVLDLNEQKIRLPNASAFVLSDSQAVWVAPWKEVELLPKTQINFSGQVSTNFCLFFGANFSFDYDNYEVQMPEVATIKFEIYEREKIVTPLGYSNWEYTAERVRDSIGNLSIARQKIASVIEETHGVLKIDAPNNKSGRKKTAFAYPFFESAGGKVYYNTVHKAYSKANFYYELAPFKISNLSRLRVEQLKFKGTFYGAAILPPLPISLSLVYRDLSLGWRLDTVDLAVYVKESTLGKGHFAGTLDLSNQGLIGNGYITSNWGQIMLKNAVLYPEKIAMHLADSIQVASTKNIPSVHAYRVAFSWYPYADSLSLETLLEAESPFSMFDSIQVNLEGRLEWCKNQIRGQGMLEWDQAILQTFSTDVYHLESTALRADTAGILLKDKGRFVLEHENAAVHMDFENGIGRLTSNEKEGKAFLLAQDCSTSMNQFLWDMNARRVSMSVDESLGHFEWEKKATNGLAFDGEKALYDFQENLLVVKGVRNIALKGIDEITLKALSKAYVEVYKKDNEALAYRLYGMADTGDWYYIAYDNQQLKTCSSNKTYNQRYKNNLANEEAYRRLKSSAETAFKK